MFAFLALAGDVGGTVGPAVVGSVSELSGNNLQSGVLAGIGFPLMLIVCVVLARRMNKRTTDGII